jgi:hypothetical protein
MTEKALQGKNITPISQIEYCKRMPKSVRVAGNHVNTFSHPMQMASQNIAR